MFKISLGSFQWEVMACIVIFSADASVAGLVEHLSKRLDRTVDSGEVSRAVKKLVARGFVVGVERPDDGVRAMKRRPRQFYKLTPEGKRIYDIVAVSESPGKGCAVHPAMA